MANNKNYCKHKKVTKRLIKKIKTVYCGNELNKIKMYGVGKQNKSFWNSSLFQLTQLQVSDSKLMKGNVYFRQFTANL